LQSDYLPSESGARISDPISEIVFRKHTLALQIGMPHSD
jgi:hypothetical protein